MNTQHTTDRAGLPPPRTFEFDLSDAGHTVGTIDGNVVGFRGFANATEAVHAAWVAYRTLARRIARTQEGRPLPIDVASIVVQRQEGNEVILADGRPIATLVRFAADDASGTDSYGFEVRVPPPADELHVRAMAHLMYRTLRKSGVRWSLWNPVPARAEVRQRATHSPEPGRNTMTAHLSRNHVVAAPRTTAASPLVFFSTLFISLVTVTMAIALVMMVSLAVTVPLGIVIAAGFVATAVVVFSDRWIEGRDRPAIQAVTPRPVPPTADSVWHHR